MTHSNVYYTALLASDESGRVTSVLAHQTIEGGRLRAVMWSGRRKAWIYAPLLVANYLYAEDFLDRTRMIDRPTAEQLAREVLQEELPSEQTLLEMFDEGQQMGWTLGPPR